MIWIITISTFIASILTFFSGFGLGTILMPVMSIFFPITTAIAITALVHLLSNLFKLAIVHKQIDWKVTFKFGIPAFIAAIIGAFLLTNLEVLPYFVKYNIFQFQATITPVKLLIGILLISFSIVEWLNILKQYHISKNYLSIGGLLSGFFGGLSGNQGAFRSVFLLHVGLDKNQFVATNAAIASIVDTSRLLVYGINLKIIIDEVNNNLIIVTIIAAFLGLIFGKICLQNITVSFIQRLVAVLLLILGTLITVGII